VVDRIVDYLEDILFFSARNYAGTDHEQEVVVVLMVLMAHGFGNLSASGGSARSGWSGKNVYSLY
jgi:hypothetical protein